MPRIRLIVLALALFGAACTTSRPVLETAPAATPTLTGDVLPIDPAVRTGTLPNGLRYYIRRNTEPKNRAELRLAVDAGAVYEQEDERGVAHFLEHMLFNGTRSFPESDLVDFLERTGMRFGPDVNAYTSFDETVYMLQIPMDSTEIVETAFTVLQEWAAYALLSPEEIDKERGVVLSEWRERGQNFQARLRDKVLPALFYGSRYKDRLPIGLPEILETVPPETVRAFYERWYTPDRMAVVAVGDFDPARIEALIRDRFADLPGRGDAPAEPSLEVPDHDETRYVVATDPEMPYTGVTVYFKQGNEPIETVAAYRDRLVGQLFNDMLNERLDELARAPEAPFVGASVYRGSLARPAAFYAVGAQVQDDGILKGLDAVLTEVARVRAHGFAASELERQKSELLRTYERLYQERTNTRSAAFADEYVSHFLEGQPAPGIEYEHDLVKRLVPGITLSDANDKADALLAAANRVVIVQMPEKPGVTPPAEADLARVLAAVDERDVDPYTDAVADGPLVAEVPAPAPVTSTRRIDEVGVTEAVLANGVRVVMKPTAFKEDEIRFTAFSPGGSSLVADDDVVEADLAATLVTQSGVGPFTLTELQKQLAGKVVSVSPYIGELSEGLRGQASPQDLEVLFQLIHLYFTAPRADSSALATVQNQMRAFLANRSANPSMVFQDSLQALLYGDHPRRRPLTIDRVERLDLQKALALYRDRFADAGDFTFVFAGNLDVDRVTTLAQTYLGTLPATPRDETWRDVYPDLPAGVRTKTVRKGIGQQGQALLLYHGAAPYNRDSRHALRTLADVLEIELREELRETRGAVYGVNVQASTTAEPDSTYRLFINFTTAPDRVDELVEATNTIIDRIKTSGPLADTVEKVREQQRRERETAVETNGFWVSVLEFYYDNEHEPLLDVLRYNELISAITPASVQATANRYLDPAHFVRAVLLPE